MMKLTTAISAAALLVAATVAHGAESSGRIKALDEKSHALTLEDGTVYRVSSELGFDGLEPGMEVLVSFEEKDGAKVVDRIQYGK